MNAKTSSILQALEIYLMTDNGITDIELAEYLKVHRATAHRYRKELKAHLVTSGRYKITPDRPLIALANAILNAAR